MQNLFAIWLALSFCLAVIGVAGSKLSRHGDIHAKKYGPVAQLGGTDPAGHRHLAAAMGWEQSFVGTLFVAVVTTTPEIVVTVTALRMGAIDLAIGNLFGSNLFNIAVLAIDDLAYLPGPLLADVSLAHAASAFFARMMSGLAVVGLVVAWRRGYSARSAGSACCFWPSIC